MFDTINLTPVLHRQDAFSAETTYAVRAALERVFSLPTRLMSLRSLIFKLAKGYVANFELRASAECTSQHYRLAMGDYTVWVRVGAFSPSYKLDRFVEGRQTVLAINDLLRDLGADWQSNKNLDRYNEFNIIKDIVLRVFLLCSADAKFECTTEIGRWTLFFHDEPKRAQAELVVERRA